ncbi:MAG: class D sortase [Oscillospiraceae bacterium]|nr:class D sortase [Oscillospiraceae bacterium]
MMSIKAKKETKKRSRRKWAILLALLLILIGSGIAVYPYARTWIFEYQQRDLMNKWQLRIAGIGGYQNSTGQNQNDADNQQNGLDASANDDSNGLNSSDLNDNGIFEEDANAAFNVNYALNLMTGTLKIPSIDLYSPILKGDTPENLNIAICEVADSTAAMGGIGNYILAGHYSRIYGRHFNRLHEVQIGASVFISDGYNIYEYKVYDIVHVKAEDTSAVILNTKEREATLITCDYSVNPIGRLIVKCRMG